MELLSGIVLVIIGGVLEGLFSLGVTRTPKWAWENIWGLGSLVALIVIPWPLAFLTVPHLGQVFAAVGWIPVMAMLLCGVAWGFGSIFWGKAIAALGMALGVSLIMGLANVFGGPLPLWIFNPGIAAALSALVLYVAVAIVIVGIILISLAGKRREKDLTGGAAMSTKLSAPFIMGFIFCLLCAILSASLSIGPIYAKNMAHFGDIAAKYGAPVWSQMFAVWALIFTGCYSVNFIYALILMIRNRNVNKIFSAGGASHWFWAIFLGLAWPLGVVLYGIGEWDMGSVGAYVALPMLWLFAVLAGTTAGVVQGEWRGSSAVAKKLMFWGVFVLIIAFALLGYSAKLST